MKNSKCTYVCAADTNNDCYRVNPSSCEGERPMTSKTRYSAGLQAG